MARKAVAGLVPQYAKNAGGAAAADYWLKFYSAGSTTTSKTMYTAQEGGSSLSKCTLNSRGETISNSSDDDSTFIPYVDGDYDAYLFFTEDDADANNTTAAFFLGTLENAPDAPATNFSDYSSLRSVNSSLYEDGDVIFVTDDGIAGEFVIKTGTVTDNGGTLIVFTDDSNRYAERIKNTGIEAEWGESSSSGANIQNVINQIDGLSGGLATFQNGTYLTDTTLTVELSGNYKESETRIIGEAQESTQLSGDTLTSPSMTAVIEFKPTSPNASGYNSEFSNMLVTCNDTAPANRAVNGISIDRGARKKFHDLTLVGFDNNILITDQNWLGSYENISMVRDDSSNSSHYGIRFDAGGTSNWFNQCFVNATDTIGYALRGDYSAIGTMAADNCTGTVYDFTAFNGSALCLGAESADAEKQINASNSRLIIDSIHMIHVGADDPTTKVFDFSGSDIVIKAGRLGASDGTAVNDGQLFELGSSSFELGFYVVPEVTFETNPITAGDYDAVLKVNDRYTTGILVNEGGGGRPSMGMDKLAMDTTYSNTNLDYYNVTPELEAKQIYLDVVGEPRFDFTSLVEVTVTGISGTYTPGEFVTGTTGQGILKQVNGSVLEFHRGTVNGSFTGTLTGADSGATSTFSSSSNTGKNFAAKKGPFLGDFMYESRPDQVPFLGYVVLEDLATTGSDTTKFGTVQYNLSGATADRPQAFKNNSLYIGFQYFDTTLGQPIWWNGTGWVDATGSAA